MIKVFLEMIILSRQNYLLLKYVYIYVDFFKIIIDYNLLLRPEMH